MDELKFFTEFFRKFNEYLKKESNGQGLLSRIASALSGNDKNSEAKESDDKKITDEKEVVDKNVKIKDNMRQPLQPQKIAEKSSSHKTNIEENIGMSQEQDRIKPYLGKLDFEFVQPYDDDDYIVMQVHHKGSDKLLATVDSLKLADIPSGVGYEKGLADILYKNVDIDKFIKDFNSIDIQFNAEQVKANTSAKEFELPKGVSINERDIHISRMPYSDGYGIELRYNEETFLSPISGADRTDYLNKEVSKTQLAAKYLGDEISEHLKNGNGITHSKAMETNRGKGMSI